MLNEQTIFNIAETLDLLVNKIHSESGNKIMIMFSIENGEDCYTGGVKGGKIDFGLACRMAVSMTHYISDKYGEGEID